MMKKALPLLLIAVFAFCQPQYQALIFETPPTIDGDLTEYQGKIFLFLPYCTIPKNLWRGPKDAEAMIWLGLDKDNLYIAGDVWDDFRPQKGEPAQESIQLFLNTDWQITYSPLDNKLTVLKGGAPFEATFPFAVKSSNASYQFEMAIPWNLLGITPQNGAILKYNAALNDTDFERYRGYLSWTSGKDQLGDVILSSPPTPPTQPSAPAQPSAPSQISFLFAPSPLYIGDEETDITTWLMVNRDFKGKFKFSLKGDNDVLLEKEQDVEGKAGFIPFTVHWDARGKPVGTYKAEASLTLDEMGQTLSAELTVNKYDAQALLSSLQEELDAMNKAVGGAKQVRNWRDGVLVLQGNAWQSRASSFLELLNQKIKATTSKPDPDEVVLAKIFLWESEKDVSAYKASSALIRGDYQSPALQPFPTLRIPASKELSYLWNWERWQEDGSFERLGLLYANLPIASLSLWTHSNQQILANRANAIQNNWRRASLSPEGIGGTDWQGLIAVFPEGGAQAIAQQGNRIWLAEALSKDACLFLLNSAISGQAITKIDSLLPPLQPDIFVEDIGKAVGFDFPSACFFAAKDDVKSLALAGELSGKLGGKIARLEEVNRFSNIVIIGSTALHQLVSGFKFPAPERKAYILSRYLWGKRVLILVGKDDEGTRLAVDVLKDLIDYVRDRRMLVGDMQDFLSAGGYSPLQLCLSAMGALCDFLAIADVGTREGARDALWLTSEKNWRLTVIPGETFPLGGGEIVSLGAIESVKENSDANELLKEIHKAGGIGILRGDSSLGSLPFDAIIVDESLVAMAGKPLVAGTGGDFSSPLRTVVYSGREGIYDILTGVKRGECLAFSPARRMGNGRINRVLNLLIDERVYLMRVFGDWVRGKALTQSP